MSLYAKHPEDQRVCYWSPFTERWKVCNSHGVPTMMKCERDHPPTIIIREKVGMQTHKQQVEARNPYTIRMSNGNLIHTEESPIDPDSFHKVRGHEFMKVRTVHGDSIYLNLAHVVSVMEPVK